MLDLQRAVDTTAVLHCDAAARSHILLVAGVTEVVLSSAVKESNGAAIVALPVNVAIAVLLALVSARAKVFEKAGLAAEIIFTCILSLFEGKLLLTVNQTSKEGVKALRALIEGASVESKHQGLLKVGVTRCLQSFTLEKTLSLSHLESFLFDFHLQLENFANIFCNHWHILEFLDFSLTRRTTEKGEGDFQ